jgi:hypothetical protein
MQDLAARGAQGLKHGVAGVEEFFHAREWQGSF